MVTNVLTLPFEKDWLATLKLYSQVHAGYVNVGWHVLNGTVVHLSRSVHSS